MVHRLVLAETVCYIWQERNYRLFTHERRTKSKLSNVMENVKSKLMSLRVKRSKVVLVVC